MIEARSTNGVPDDGRWVFPVHVRGRSGPVATRRSRACTPPPSGGSDGNFAWAAKVKPFVVESNQQFLSKGPNALNSGLYAKEYNEVKDLGVAGLVRTGEQLTLFNFFQANPVEMFSRSFRTYALAQGLDLVEQARLFGLFGLAGGDTSISRAGRTRGTGASGGRRLLFGSETRTGTRRLRRSTAGRQRLRRRRTPTIRRGTTATTGVYMTIAELYFGQGRTTFIVLQPERDDAGVRALPRRVGGHDRCPRLSRHPLPLPRRSGRENRPRRRPLGRQARPAGSQVGGAAIGGRVWRGPAEAGLLALRPLPRSSRASLPEGGDTGVAWIREVPARSANQSRIEGDARLPGARASALAHASTVSPGGSSSPGVFRKREQPETAQQRRGRSPGVREIRNGSRRKPRRAHPAGSRRRSPTTTRRARDHARRGRRGLDT